MSLTARSYCTGYGGLEMAVRAAFGDFEVLSHSDIKTASVALLEHHHPDIPNLGDMRQVDYTALERRPAADDPAVVYALRFTYPPLPTQSAADAAAKKLDSQLQSAGTQRARNADYWYCGGPVLKPIAASDDVVHTRLRFAANSDLPAIFVRNEDGSESLLNFNMDSGDVIVHRVAKQFILRRGKLTGCVVNHGFAGGGMRLESGTVTPEVERTVPGSVP